jgi:hypothetical protein
MYDLIGMTIVNDLRDNAGHQSVKRYVNEISLIVLRFADYLLSSMTLTEG